MDKQHEETISPNIEEIKKLQKTHLEGEFSYLSDLEDVICCSDYDLITD